jgi:hypothetical protein
VSEDPGPADDSTNPVRRTLDLLVFAPVGVAMTVAEDLPGLIDKGRQRMEMEIRNARLVGEFVVTRGQRDLSERLGRLLHGEVTTTADPGPGAEEPAAPMEAVSRPAPNPGDGALVEQALAGYDTLSASQVVRRLESLHPDQLRAVHRHEASHRNRRTILNRTNQLLGTGPAVVADPPPGGTDVG